jgi:PGF-pre-PGF domain-containing protein
MWIAGGREDGPVFKNDTWYSSNGNIWTLATASAAFPAREAHTSFVLGNKMWLLGGADSSGYYNDTWYTEAAPVPVVTTMEGSDSGSDTPSVQSSIKETGHSDEPITFTFGKSLSAANPVRIESVTIIPQQTFSGEIRCIVRKPVTASPPIPEEFNTAGFAEIVLDWIREDAVQQGAVVFSLDRAWLTTNNHAPTDIVMFHAKNGQWEQLPTSFIREETGRVWFSAITPGFSRFAVAAGNVSLSPQQATEIPPLTGTISEVSPAMQVTDIPERSSSARMMPVATTDALPALDYPTQGNGLPLVPIVIAAVIILVGGGFLVRRWWIHRQNPALFREYK